MPDIENEGLYQSPLLSNVASRYRNRKMIAEMVLTAVGVPKKNFKYLEWDRGPTFKRAHTEMAPNGTPNQLQVKATKKDGRIEVKSLSDFIDQEDISEADISLQAAVTEFLTEAMLLDQEIRVATLLRDTTILTLNDTLVGANQWSDDTSDPIKYLQGKSDGLIAKPNTLVLGRPVYSKLRNHPKVVDRAKYTLPGAVPDQILAQVFDVDRIIVGEAFVDQAKEGQSEDMQFVWGKDAILAYVTDAPPSPLMDKPTLGYLPRLSNQKSTPWRVFTGRTPTRGTGEGSLMVKVESTYDPIITAVKHAFLVKNAVA